MLSFVIQDMQLDDIVKKLAYAVIMINVSITDTQG